MSDLFSRTLSQGLQAFVPVALFVALQRRRGQVRLVRSARAAVLAAATLTLPVAALFRTSDHQALWELACASAAAAIVFLFLRSVGRDGRGGHAESTAVFAAIALLVIRQTQEIGAVALTAVEMRSDALVPIVTATGLAIALAWSGGFLVQRANATTAGAAVSAAATVFFVQLLVYTFHEAAEARILPWSDALHVATEPYGPDGIYGRHVSDLLLVAPLLAGIAHAWRRRLAAVDRGRRFARGPWQIMAGAAVAILAAGGAAVAVRGAASAANHASTAPVSVGLERTLNAPHVLYRHTAIDAEYGLLAVAPLDAPASREFAALSCERIAFSGGRGICLRARRGVFTTYDAVLFDARLNTTGTIRLGGSPSRARVSPDGRVGAATVFVSGDAYTTNGFSTRTTLIDMETGTVLGDLEQFSTWRDGSRIASRDFNFWGVTFSRDANVFFATLKTGGRTWLVKGDLGLRRVTVLREGVECPSLSPDGLTIAFKRKIGTAAGAWRIYLLDVRSLVERPLAAESRDVDDQVEWLDDAHVLYAIPRAASAVTDVFVAPTDAAGAAHIFVSEAASPAVVR